MIKVLSKVPSPRLLSTFPAMSKNKFYELRSNQIGCLVYGIDLKKPVSEECKEQIIEDVRDHRLLVFKDQGLVPPERQLEISKWFGEIVSTFYDHPKSPHRDIFRVSNDESEGCTFVGRTGWHIDGSFQHAPFSHSIYHIVECPKKGATVFAPLSDIIEDLPQEKRELWDRLWMLSDRRDQSVRPLIYRHPETGKPTLCFHTGMTSGFIVDKDKPEQRLTTPDETRTILKGITEEFEKEDGKWQYKHEWEPGDFIISDNLALGHMAAEETQYPKSEVGLRVMHRVTVGGKHPPRK